MLTLGGVRTLVVTIYRLDGRNNAFYGEFESLLELIVVYNCNFIILGDVNIHLDVATDPSTRRFSSTIGLSQMVETSTHRAAHTLGIVLVRRDRSEGVSISVQPQVISDNSVITIHLPMCRPPPISFNVTTRPWKDFDREAFSRELLDRVLCSSEDVWKEMSVDDLSEAYSSVLSSIIDRLAPRIVVRKHFRPITPWFNAACRAEKRRSRCFERVYRRTGLAQDRSNWINQLRSSQLVYQRVQHEFWQTLITNSSGNARKLWNSLSSVMGRNRQSSTISSGLTANSFAKFFRDKVCDVRSSTAGAADPEYTVFHGHPLDEFAQLSISDVERLIKDSPTKACGLDPIPTWLVKEFG